MTELVTVAAALGSAGAASTSSVLQHHAARRAVPRRRAAAARRQGAALTRVGLLAYLARQPRWLLGLLMAVVGLGLHTVALSGGRLTLVQPILVSGLVFALLASRLLEGRAPSLVESGWAAVLMLALAVFLLSARPSAGHAGVHGALLAEATLAGGLAAGALVVLPGTRAGPHRAAVLATVAGVCYGITAALLKLTMSAAARGLGAVATSWSLYALVAMGALALVLTQLAYHAGPLAQSLPALTVSDPAASILLGVLVFGDHLGGGLGLRVLELAAFAVMAWASRQLARRAQAARDATAGRPGRPGWLVTPPGGSGA